MQVLNLKVDIAPLSVVVVVHVARGLPTPSNVDSSVMPKWSRVRRRLASPNFTQALHRDAVDDLQEEAG